jgi:hypothetical protein
MCGFHWQHFSVQCTLQDIRGKPVCDCVQTCICSNGTRKPQNYSKLEHQKGREVWEGAQSVAHVSTQNLVTHLWSLVGCWWLGYATFWKTRQTALSCHPLSCPDCLSCHPETSNRYSILYTGWNHWKVETTTRLWFCYGSQKIIIIADRFTTSWATLIQFLFWWSFFSKICLNTHIFLASNCLVCD